MPGPKLDASQAGRALVAGDVALGAGFGTSPILTIEGGSNDSRGAITVTAQATAAQATATVTVTFARAKDHAPFVVVSRYTADEAEPDTVTKGWNVVSTSVTGFVVVANTIPVDDDDIGFSYVVVE
jgi:hypothetical protein